MNGTVSGDTNLQTKARQGSAPGSAPQPLAWHLPDLLHGDRGAPTADWRRRYRRRAIIGDFVAALIACTTAALVRWGGIPNFRVAVLATVVPIVWLIVIAYAGGYRQASLGIGLDEYRSIGKGLVILLALVAVMLVSLGWQMSRLLIGVAVPATFLLTVIARWLLRGRLAAARSAGKCLQPTIVVGRGLPVPEMIAELRRDPHETGMTVVGVCVSDLPDPSWIQDVTLYGGPETALLAVRDTGAEAVVIASDSAFSGKTLRRLGWALSEMGVDLYVHPGIHEVAAPRLTLRPAAGMSLLHVEGPTIGGIDAIVKRAIDIVCSAMILLVTAPLWAIAALSVKLHDRGPVFFIQQRVGEEGKTFPMVKFRTMVVDAEARLAELEAHRHVNELLFKHKEDPRITGPGKWLRRFSVDELPQLLNVLRGEMSLVGPRPPLPKEVDAYEPDAMRRLKVRPGLTGMWQISGRSDLNWEDSLRLDLWYVDNWSPVLDVMILFRTVRAVTKADGAY